MAGAFLFHVLCPSFSIPAYVFIVAGQRLLSSLTECAVIVNVMRKEWTDGRNVMDELEPASKAAVFAHELREVAGVIERCPEFADLDNLLDAAQLLLMDLDAL